MGLPLQKSNADIEVSPALPCIITPAAPSRTIFRLERHTETTVTYEGELLCANFQLRDVTPAYLPNRADSTGNVLDI